MIAFLTGILKFRGATHVVVDVAGVGYQVFVSLESLSHLPPEGETISLYIELPRVRVEGFYRPAPRQ